MTTKRYEKCLDEAEKNFLKIEEDYTITKDTLEEILDLISSSEDLSYPDLEDADKRELTKLTRKLQENVRQLPDPKQDKTLSIEQQQIIIKIEEKNYTIGLRVGVETAFKRLEEYESTLEARKAEYENYEAKMLDKIAKLEQEINV